MAAQQSPAQARLPRAFLARPVLEVAPELLGCTISHAGVAVRLTEVEAYDGSNDPGSHAFRGPTPRTQVMFGEPGGLYVYFTYGMHWCANLVCGPAGTASAVLLRAGEVVGGLETARARRAGAIDRDLARGPARLTKALALTGDQNGIDTVASGSAVKVRAATPQLCPVLGDYGGTPAIGSPEEVPAPAPGPSPAVLGDSGPAEVRAVTPGSSPVLPGASGAVVRTGPRVGVSGRGGDAAAYPWRFWLEGEATVSAYRPAVARPPKPPVRARDR